MRPHFKCFFAAWRKKTYFKAMLACLSVGTVCFSFVGVFFFKQKENAETQVVYIV